jgi:hypothetical protein
MSYDVIRAAVGMTENEGDNGRNGLPDRASDYFATPRSGTKL